jgi:hypothetical protein
LVSGSVSESSTFNGWRLRNFPRDAHYRQIAEAPDTEVKAVLPGNILVLQNVRLEPQWFLWHQYSNAGSMPLSENDELQARCSSGLANPDYLKNTVEVVNCSRIVNQQGLNLSYTFRSASNVPIDFSRLDESTFAVIKNWQCKQQRSNNSFKPKPLRGSA